MKKDKFRSAVLLFLLLFWLAPVRVFAAEEDADVTHAPYFFIENADPSLDSFPLKATDVTTNINGMIAETFVQQTRVFNTCSRIKSLGTAEMRYFFVKFFFTFCCICCIIIHVLFTAVMK